MRVLLVSTYELGHQPLHVASPAAALAERGHEVRCIDVSVDPWDPAAVDWADAVALSVPMHTAMRLAMHAARAVKQQRPDLPVCFYGLYAPVSRDLTVGRVADRVIGGEYEPELCAWIDGGSMTANGNAVYLGRSPFRVPARHLLPPLERYAHLHVAGEQQLVGYVEASHGCVHHCRHCPIPPVYGGRIRIVDVDTVVADVAQLVESGAQHITFGDPDFLNGPHHSLRVVRALHARFPQVTFDCTTKVEHILRHAEIWPELAASGCIFVVSAFESVNDEILRCLDKGHTTADAREVTAVLRAAGIDVRPSFLPFTPWTTLDDMVDLIDFVAAQDLIGNVDPVQYTIRLLLPEGSLLLDHEEMAPYLGDYDAEGLSYTWHAADPRIDELQARLSSIVEARTAGGEPHGAPYLAIAREVYEAAGVAGPPEQIPVGAIEGRPRLTEPWFC